MCGVTREQQIIEESLQIALTYLLPDFQDILPLTYIKGLMLIAEWGTVRRTATFTDIKEEAVRMYTDHRYIMNDNQVSGTTLLSNLDDIEETPELQERYLSLFWEVREKLYQG